MPATTYRIVTRIKTITNLKLPTYKRVYVEVLDFFGKRITGVFQDFSIAQYGAIPAYIAAQSAIFLAAYPDAVYTATDIIAMISGGVNAYCYIAYASDSSGTNFTNTFDPTLDYIAVLSVNTPKTPPVVGDFAGLWKNYKGTAGTNGTNGLNGSNGTNGIDGYTPPCTILQGTFGNGLQISYDGITFTRYNSGLTSANIRGLDISPSGRIFISTSNEFCYGDNPLLGWNPVTSGSAVFKNGFSLGYFFGFILGYFNTPNEAWISNDNGVTWLPCRQNIGDTYISCLDSIDTVQFGKYGLNYYAVNYINGLETAVIGNLLNGWSVVVGNALTGLMFQTMLKVNNIYYIACEDGTNNIKLFWTLDFNTFNVISITGLPSGASFNPYGMAYLNGVLFIYAAAGGVYKSINGGITWTLATTGLGSAGIYCMQSYAKDIYAGTDSGLFVSHDIGATWQLLEATFTGSLLLL